MFVQTEPNGFLMVRYKLYFNQQTPDPEDACVFEYLAEHGLEPRRELAEEHDGILFKVWHFGQCYLGRHVEALGDLYRRGVEQSVLAQYIRTLLDRTDDATARDLIADLDEETCQSLSIELAARLHHAAHFEATADNHLQVSIEPATVIEACVAVLQQSRSG